MKSDGEIMEILAAYDLTGSVRSAAVLVGCSHHTVAAHVAARDAGRPVGDLARRPQVTDPFLDKIEEWVEASKGRIRADKAHEKLLALGYGGSDRSTRRAVAGVKAAYRLGHARVHRPWVTEPGMWLQYDFGDGPVVDGVKTVLFVAWLAWSRFRVVIALRDRTQPSVIAALDRTFRLLGGAPTYVLTDNEKTVTVEHVAGVPVRNRETVSFGRHYGVTVLTCQPADPASQGRGGGVGESRQGRPGPHRHEPARPSTARSLSWSRRVRQFMARGERPGASGDPPGAGRDARRGTASGCTGSPTSRTRSCSGWPAGSRFEHADGDLRARPVLRPAAPAR